jgi:hypothetical protein
VLVASSTTAIPTWPIAYPTPVAVALLPSPEASFALPSNSQQPTSVGSFAASQNGTIAMSMDVSIAPSSGDMSGIDPSVDVAPTQTPARDPPRSPKRLPEGHVESGKLQNPSGSHVPPAH